MVEAKKTPAKPKVDKAAVAARTAEIKAGAEAAKARALQLARRDTDNAGTVLDADEDLHYYVIDLANPDHINERCRARLRAKGFELVEGATVVGYPEPEVWAVHKDVVRDVLRPIRVERAREKWRKHPTYITINREPDFG
jgi:hypothetical protein